MTAPVPSPREAQSVAPRSGERVRERGRVAAGVSLGLAAAACEEVIHRDIGDEINILIRRNDQLVPPATERLAALQARRHPANRDRDAHGGAGRPRFT